ncbi:Neuropeptides B/W receptor type 1 [Willisornis vidua]|uniref:Neuropeptides B/W receptor type 1 n=1 Tax=Willisornis vidua TaxID=1566151 RepID=A0ABQ9D2M1_9PASS|nr:Neuropeptides B/W receptor type 1 [Willisornis vidua]
MCRLHWDRTWGSMSTPPLSPTFYITVPVIFSVICAVGLTGNTAVIYVFLKVPKMKTVTNLFILNLAIPDEIFTLVLPINIADYLLLQWPFREFMCKLIISIDQYNTFFSIYFLTVTSINHSPVVVATTKFRKMTYHTYQAAKIMSLCIWSFVTIIILPFTVFAKIHNKQELSQCVFVFPHPESVCGNWIYILILGFVIPLSTTCTLYTTMLCRLRRAAPLRCESPGQSQKKR